MVQLINQLLSERFQKCMPHFSILRFHLKIPFLLQSAWLFDIWKSSLKDMPKFRQIPHLNLDDLNERAFHSN